MYRYFPLIALTLTLGLSGCNRSSDTQDPANVEPTPPDESATEITEESITTPAPPNAAETPTDDSATVAICTPEWFAWVHEQILARQNGNLADLYPAGLPEVGTAEWFLAVDKITGGDGAHGPDGGSAEWCRMIQQRLSQSPQ